MIRIWTRSFLRKSKKQNPTKWELILAATATKKCQKKEKRHKGMSNNINSDSRTAMRATTKLQSQHSDDKYKDESQEPKKPGDRRK